ncbi:MAG: hypothetical protein ACRD11_14350 [Terriglobia bacterium]
MRLWASVVAALLLSSAAFCGQKQNAPPPTLGPPSGQPAPPTLGAAPSLGGPTTATIMDARKLRSVKTVYIGYMDNKLNVELLDDFAKQGPFRVVTNRKEADAILQGTCFDSPHLKEVHSEVFLTGQDGKAIWQDVIHEPYRPPSLTKAVDETAGLIITHLRQSIEVTDRK